MRGDVRDKLWRQLESEILLQRHKTVVRACRRNNHVYLNGNSRKTSDANSIVPTNDQGLSDTRLVTVKRSHGQGLGISITVRLSLYLLLFDYRNGSKAPYSQSNFSFF